MSAIDRALNHYKTLAGEPKVIQVPEWADDDGNPLLIHVTPITCAEFNKIERLSKGGDTDLAVQAIILKSLDEEGKPLFEKEHAVKLKQGCDMAVVSRIAGEITQTLVSTEEAEKN